MHTDFIFTLVQIHNISLTSLLQCRRRAEQRASGQGGTPPSLHYRQSEGPETQTDGSSTSAGPPHGNHPL